MDVYTRFLSLFEMVRSFIPDFLVCWRYQSFSSIGDGVVVYILVFFVCMRWCGRLYQIS